MTRVPRTTAESATLSDARRWRAVEARDASLDGTFLYGVLTTGVYCRPGCASRTPRRENVRFYDTASAAEADGLRPCKRCRPSAPEAADVVVRIRDLCRYLEAHADETITLAQLAARACVSPHHLQRTFKAQVGVSPKQYLDHLRVGRFKRALRAEGGEVTRSIFDAGYGSVSRLYERLDTRLGMTPVEYRSGGQGLSITYASAKTPLGLLMIGATDRGLCFVQFGEQESALSEQLRAQYPNATIGRMREPASPEFRRWIARITDYLEGRAPDARLPVHVRATAFQLMVWTCLQSIPPGSVASYQEVARAIGRPEAARAVARACASNPVALVVPCHRVVRGTGEMGGYRWGVDRKRAVLDLERRVSGSAGS